MSPKIQNAVQRAKTCAPARCKNEEICFILATEVERLHKLLDTTVLPTIGGNPDTTDITPIGWETA